MGIKKICDNVYSFNYNNILLELNINEKEKGYFLLETQIENLEKPNDLSGYILDPHVDNVYIKDTSNKKDDFFVNHMVYDRITGKHIHIKQREYTPSKELDLLIKNFIKDESK